MAANGSIGAPRLCDCQASMRCGDREGHVDSRTTRVLTRAGGRSGVSDRCPGESPRGQRATPGAVHTPHPSARRHAQGEQLRAIRRALGDQDPLSAGERHDVQRDALLAKESRAADGQGASSEAASRPANDARAALSTPTRDTLPAQLSSPMRRCPRWAATFSRQSTIADGPSCRASARPSTASAVLEMPSPGARLARSGHESQPPRRARWLVGRPSSPTKWRKVCGFDNTKITAASKADRRIAPRM
jgi:hypothetical protein